MSDEATKDAGEATCGGVLTWRPSSRASYGSESICPRCGKVHSAGPFSITTLTCDALAPAPAEPKPEPTPAYVTAFLERNTVEGPDLATYRALLSMLAEHAYPGPDGWGEGAVETLKRLIETRRDFMRERDWRRRELGIARRLVADVVAWIPKLTAPGGLNPPGYCPPLERLRAWSEGERDAIPSVQPESPPPAAPAPDDPRRCAKPAASSSEAAPGIGRLPSKPAPVDDPPWPDDEDCLT